MAGFDMNAWIRRQVARPSTPLGRTANQAPNQTPNPAPEPAPNQAPPVPAGHAGAGTSAPPRRKMSMNEAIRRLAGR